MPGQAPFGQAWLVTIAHRKAIDVTRATKRAAVPVGDAPERAAPPRGRDLDLAAALPLTAPPPSAPLTPL